MSDPSIRILVADDSPTARALLTAVLESDPALRVVGQATDGREAVEMAERLEPDLVVMDVHMPRLDGLEATREIMSRSPRPILMVSAVGNEREMDLSLSATQAGALMALPKPSGPGAADFEERRSQLVDMAKAMARVKVVRRWRRSGGPPQTRPTPVEPAHHAPPRGVELVAIAASTGGPAALKRVLAELPRDLPVPVLVVQHIARDFSRSFAEWLGGEGGPRVKLAEAGEALLPGTVYVAPDDRHLGVSRRGEVLLSGDPPLAGFRPSATFLFESAGRAYGARLAAVVLTGMGSDGADGLAVARGLGAYVLAQNEESSVVFGMAREAVNRGLAHLVVPLEEIAGRIVELCAGRAGE